MAAEQAINGTGQATNTAQNTQGVLLQPALNGAASNVNLNEAFRSSDAQAPKTQTVDQVTQCCCCGPIKGIKMPETHQSYQLTGHPSTLLSSIDPVQETGEI